MNLDRTLSLNQKLAIVKMQLLLYLVLRVPLETQHELLWLLNHFKYKKITGFMKSIFISFDFHKNRQYRYLLSAFNKNPEIDIIFSDQTPSEIQSWDIARIKAVLTTKIRQATHTLLIIGEDINTKHKHSALIGQLNWQHWEIIQSIKESKKIIVVRLRRYFPLPDILQQTNISLVEGFTIPGITKAIKNS